MPSFVPRSNSEQKQELFEKRVLQLIGAVNAGHNMTKIVNAAEKLRLAAFSLIKAKRHKLAWGNREQQLANLEQEEERWRAITIDEIVLQYASQSRSKDQDFTN